ncbi:Uncharacterised protein [uncultured archaeon]|nr:Uncharacterised protein [uncultured archaeon]
MKIGIWAMGALFVMVLLVGMVAADDSGVICPPSNLGCPCSDGTAYYKCSQTQPGYACVESGGKHMLVNMLGPDGIKSLKSQCACANFAGYSEVNGQCVKTICTDGGNTLQNGQCGSSKPKQCLNGNMIDNSSACGCVAGYNPNPNGKTCDQRIGCRWNTYTCPTGRECKYDSKNNNDDGSCVSKSGCVNNNPSCNWNENCDTSSDANGVCKTKPGCQYGNPTCGSGKVCNQVTGNCDSTGSAATVPTIPVQGGSSAPSATTNSSKTAAAGPLGSLSCCCLPGAGAAAMVGLASYSRFKKKDEEE